MRGETRAGAPPSDSRLALLGPAEKTAAASATVRCGQLEGGQAREGPARAKVSAIGSGGGRGLARKRMMHERHVGSRAGRGETGRRMEVVGLCI